MRKELLTVLAATLVIAVTLSFYGIPASFGQDGETPVTEKYVRSLEKAKCEVEYQETEDLYWGTSKVESEGRDGLKETVTLVVTKGETLVEESVKGTVMVMEPLPRVVLVGVKNKPLEQREDHCYINYQGPIKEGTGTFELPLSDYKLASRFGERNGGFHYGVDLLAPLNRKVTASDSGTVIYAACRNSFGLLVIIDHGNGFKTYYSHLNSIEVSLGQDVVQGEEVGKVGRTGNATATHLHFEIRKDKVPVNVEAFLAL